MTSTDNRNFNDFCHLIAYKSRLNYPIYKSYIDVSSKPDLNQNVQSCLLCVLILVLKS